jgi:hypothetical protein
MYQEKGPVSDMYVSTYKYVPLRPLYRDNIEFSAKNHLFKQKILMIFS